MSDLEIILNLWYVCDDLGGIYSLRGRTYVHSGTDAEKLAFLCSCAIVDYLIAHSFPIPERLHTTFVTEQARRRMSVAAADVIALIGGPGVLFEEVFVELEKQLPAQTRLSIGSKPLICITPLLASDDGSLKPITHRGGRSLGRCTRTENDSSPLSYAPELDYGEEQKEEQCSRFGGRTPPNLISAAMGTNGGQLPLEENSTFRLLPSVGDYLLWMRCPDPMCTPLTFAIKDFWEFRAGDRLLITNREPDYPATREQMEEGGPNLWKALAGDRLAWVGWRQNSTERKPTLIALVNCLCGGYVYGEPESPVLDSILSFGAPTSDATSAVRSLWMVGYDAAVALGVPETWQPDQ
jgi:hypothetical protein